jgi:hypothetical protein
VNLTPEGSKLDEPDAVVEIVEGLGSDVEREARLSTTTRAAQRQHARSCQSARNV